MGMSEKVWSNNNNNNNSCYPLTPPRTDGGKKIDKSDADSVFFLSFFLSFPSSDWKDPDFFLSPYWCVFVLRLAGLAGYYTHAVCV